MLQKGTQTHFARAAVLMQLQHVRLKVTCSSLLCFLQTHPRLPERSAVRRLPRQHVLQQVPPVEVAGEVSDVNLPVSPQLLSVKCISVKSSHT